MKLPDKRARLYPSEKEVPRPQFPWMQGKPRRRFLNGKWATWFDVNGEGHHVTLFAGKALLYWTKETGVYKEIPRG